MPKAKPPVSNAEDVPQTALRGGDLAMHLVVCVLVGGGLGYALDRWLGWTPWGMLAGGFLGFGAWLNVMWRVIKKA